MKHLTDKERLVVFWAIIIIALVVSVGALGAARRANDTATKSEHGFCIAIRTIETGAVADREVAENTTTEPGIKATRERQWRASIQFAAELRRQGYNCPARTPDAQDAYNSSQGDA